MATGLSFGVLSTFDHLSHEWSSYRSRLEQWFIANDINDKSDKSTVKRRAILLSALSEATFKLASDLALPNRIEEVGYSAIVKLLDDHFTPKRFGFAEKSTFYSATQRPGESHTQWAARIRGLAAHCSFQNLEEALLDRFIMGMAAGHEKDKLFAQDQKDLTLAKAIELAENVRCARRAAAGAVGASSAGLAGSAAGSADVFNISKKEKCSVCGFTNHKSDQCGYKNYKCKRCNRKGHLRRMCSYKDKVKFVEEGNEDEGDDGKCFFNIRCIKGRPMTECVVISGLALEFEIDSGSAVSVISENTYNSHFKGRPLSLTNKKLFSYTGDCIVSIGTIILPISYNGETHSLMVYVVRDGGPPLLGRDFIRAFSLELAPAPPAPSPAGGARAVYAMLENDESEENIIKELSSKFPRVFSGNLGTFNKNKVKLRLKPDAKPIFFKARPVPYSLKEKIDKELDRLLELGIIKPVQHSEYASPIVPALKKDGSLRLCADYSVTINKQLLIDQYPLPTVNDLLSKLHGGVQFSKIDLSMAYNQFVLDDKSQNLTCINTHRGLFNFTRLVFGLASAPAIFQRAMECVLAGIDGIIFLLDDILVTGSSFDQHKQRLTAVLQRLEDACLTVQMSKCEFFKDEVAYLGHVIDKNGVRKSPKKVKAITEAPRPSNVSQLQSFLGLTNYYRNFVPDASSILSPLYNLLNKNVKWEWTSKHDDAFIKVKNILASDSTLAHFDPNATLILTVDASSEGLGAVLSQISDDGLERPISYASRTLTSAEKKYAQIQKEATAIIFGVRRYHQYLYARSVPFVLRTDHKPLLSIFGPYKGIPEISANRLQRYAIFLSAYNYKLEYVSSKQNSADYLSRASLPAWPPREVGAGPRVEVSECGEPERSTYVNFVVEGSLPVTLADVQRETDRDDALAKVKRYVMLGWPRKLKDLTLSPYYNCRLQLSYENGCLMRGHKVVIPVTLTETLCNELHSSHFGIVKMKAEARKRFWFPGVDAALERLAGACAVCAALRPAPPRAPIAPWPLPPHSFYRVHVDFLGPFNNYMFLIIVDAYSKWVECYNMASSYGTKAVIDKLYDFMSRVGVPHTMVSDNGTSFTSQEFKHFCELNGINHILSPVYHPNSNGQAESLVKVLKKGLKGIIFANSCKKLVQDKIAKFLFDYRNSKNSTTEKSPAELVYGRALRSRLDLLSPLAPSPSSSDLTQTVERNQSLQAKHFKGTVRPEFNVNDTVWVMKYTNSNKKYIWVEGIVKKKIGTVMYAIYVPQLNSEITRHIDQIRPRPYPLETDDHQWDPDAVPDVPSTDADVVPGAAAYNRGPQRTEEGEEETDGVDPNPVGLTTTPQQAAKRRQAISPQFATPTAADDDLSD